MFGSHDAFRLSAATGLLSMTTQTTPTPKPIHECAVTRDFLTKPSERSFAALFKLFTPQLVAFFRARVREAALAEDLAQEVMLTVYRKAGQIRDHALFRAWLFKVAHNTLCRHYGRVTRELETVSLTELDYRVPNTGGAGAGTYGFEFLEWMSVLDARERDLMILRFIEQWEYHEIAAARATPIGTVQWKVFNCKKKLAAHLTSERHPTQQGFIT
jgi:RNA polymerase sigma-70 factor, ECF subfamily